MERFLLYIEKKFDGWKCILLIPLYLLFYLPCFFWLDLTDRGHYYVIHMALDDKIPFCEYFVIFYYLWFVYVVFAVGYNVFTDRETYFKSLGFIIFGMTLFIVISALFPNSHDLRPAIYPRDNIYTTLIWMIQSFDTPTNVFPSIHVYNAIGAHFAIIYNQKLKNNAMVRGISFFICFGICLSTVFLKQHSVMDVIGAITLAAIMYPVFFREEYRALTAERKERRARA
ncbi:MAG: phosphatase PAP2 family protein [Lachnospiraceae bacterium]|nr:phosphatase PAP2 family protein [Lachnospiraceae bacterium]